MTFATSVIYHSIAVHQVDQTLLAAVTGRPGHDGNEEVLAFVTLDRAALDGWLREQLAPYKRPAAIHVVDVFPMTHSGKVIKRELLASLDPTPA